MTRSRSLGVMTRSPDAMVMESRRFSPLNWMPSTVTRMPSRRVWPEVRMASSTARVMAVTVRLMSVISPWRMPPSGFAWLAPVTFRSPFSS